MHSPRASLLPMPRVARVAPGGWVYHVLNRAVGGLSLFRKEADYAAFERVMLEAYAHHPTRILAWTLMRNHWHFVIWPRKEGELTAFMRRLAHTHAMRWHVAHRTVGCGHLYQGRFKSFPIERNEHFLTVCRYVERNPLTAKLVKRAEDWRWSSLWVRRNGEAQLKSLLSDWPVDRPRNWVQTVNAAWSPKEQEALRTCIARNQPFGSPAWQAATAAKLGLQHTMRPEGRPKKQQQERRRPGDLPRGRF